MRSDRDKNDESAAREHRASRLVSDGAVRQFFPTLRNKRLPIEFERLLNIARCEIEKVSHLRHLQGLRTVYERKRREIQELSRLFNRGRRFDRIGRSRVFRRLVFRSTSKEATKYARHEGFCHHGARAEANYFIHKPAMILNSSMRGERIFCSNRSMKNLRSTRRWLV